MGRPVVHWDLMSKDPAKAAAFYEKIFGWTIQHRPELNYSLVDCLIGAPPLRLTHAFPEGDGNRQRPAHTAELKIYQGGSHDICTTEKNKVHAALLEFIKR
jgi:catechol 2,3-dioxygenase-like lactoylglutathione lyase family enzyme